MDVTEVISIRKENEQTRAAYQEVLSTRDIYENVINALSEDYFDMYYVDLETDEYIEYGSRTEKGRFMNRLRGRDFFNETKKNALTLVYEKDQQQFIDRMDKEKLLQEIEKHGSCSFAYRLLIEGEPVYVNMKVKKIEKHIIIGVTNVDLQIKQRMAAERDAEEKKSYRRINALNGNLIVLYFVDPENGQFTQYSASKEYEDLGISKQGADFFGTTYKNSLRTVHPEDQALFHSQVTKENVLATIEKDGIFALDYRLMIGELPSYVRLKAAKVEEDGKSLLIIGLLDEDAQIRQEQEYVKNLSAARKMATVDSLTGVKNKHAFVQWEEKMNEAIRNGTQEPFAVVVCDINNLKAVNDLYGHKEGDECIRNASAKICRVFAHSPVFRFGGDEFVVILTDGDYSKREELMEEINEVPEDHSKIRIGETIAAGMVDYDKDLHFSLLSVFDEADRAMYEQKRALKDLFASNEQN
jgi:diguanylate cyclase (GGDEF)-like protein